MSSLCAIDLSVLNKRYPTGISRYTRCLANALFGMPQPDIEWLTIGIQKTFHPNIEHLAYELPLHDLDACQRQLAAILAIEQANAYFSPFYPLPEKARCPTFLTFFDLLPLRHPDWFPSRKTFEFFDGPLRRSAHLASHLFAISEATKEDLQEIYGIESDRITVTHLASMIDTDKMDENERPIEDPYFLSVCTLEPRKNLERALDAFRALLDMHPEIPHKFVIVGAYGWKSETLEDKAKSLADRVIWTGFLPDEALANWYANAHALIFVSLAEGFGLPLLEAMSCGVPSLTSNCSSMPEVSGDAALYCNPHDVDDIASQWEKLLEPSIHKMLSEACRTRAPLFSWDMTARRTLRPMLAI